MAMLLAMSVLSWAGLQRARDSMSDTGLCTATRVGALLFGAAFNGQQGEARVGPSERLILDVLTPYIAWSSDLLPNDVRILSVDGTALWGFDARRPVSRPEPLFGVSPVTQCVLHSLTVEPGTGRRTYAISQPIVRNGEVIAVLELRGSAAPIDSESSRPFRELRFSLVINLVVLWISCLGLALGLSRTIRRQEEQLKALALRDALTGLANRTLLEDRLAVACRQSARTGRSVAVVLVDLDRFKPVNDAFGHEAGDRYLCEVARRLSSVVRASDTVARLGGDEFVIVSSLDDSGPHELLARLERALDQPFEVAEGVLTTTPASLGIVVATGEDRRPADLLRQADLAMYQRKRERAVARV